MQINVAKHNTFEPSHKMQVMLYHFELQMAGVILLSAMLVCGIWLYIKRRRERLQDETKGYEEESHTIIYGDDDDTHDKKGKVTYKTQDELDKNI